MPLASPPTKPTRSRWMPYASMARIDQSGECIASVRVDGDRFIVRPPTSGNYAVLALDGAMARVVKILPTCDRARGYMAAITR